MIRTGIEGLDYILNGGFVEGSNVLIEGAPGTGKTTFGLQYIYEGATRYNQSGLVITFEEFPEQMYRDALGFGWDLRKLEQENKLRIILSSPAALKSQIEQTEGVFEQLSREIDVKRVLVDSITHFQRLTSNPIELREILNSFFNALKRNGFTSILIRESTGGENATFEEYSVDTVIRVSYEAEQVKHKRARFIEVIKSRGQAFQSGKFLWRFTGTGVKIYTRIRPKIYKPLETTPPTEARVKTGIIGLDKIMNGGFLKRSINLISGSTGLGKTLTGIGFINQGLKEGESALMISFQERPEDIVKYASGIGIDFTPALRDKKLDIIYYSSADIFIDEVMDQIRSRIAEIHPTRVVIDSLTDLVTLVTSEEQARDYVIELANILKDNNITTIFTNEIPNILGNFEITGKELSFIVDSIVLLKYVEVTGEMKKSVTVMKMRGSAHDTDIRGYDITSRGIEITTDFHGMEGVLTGSPRKTITERMERYLR